MIQALNMELEIVRTVLRNDVNEICVCTNTDTGAADGGTVGKSYYTVISIFSKSIAKEIASRMAVSGLFAHISDFVGSYTHKDALHLVFAYNPESRLAYKEALYAPTFVKRKEIALSILSALAETEMRGEAGKLLLSEENLNLTADGKVYFNYFLDFENMKLPEGPENGVEFYRDAAKLAADVLSREYEAKYDGRAAMYPNDLRLMYKKVNTGAFRSISQIMAFVKTLPDKPVEQRFGVMRMAGVFEGFFRLIFGKPANLLLTAVVLITLVYLGYQIAVRVTAGQDTKRNTVYAGMTQIGDIYLGEDFD